MRGLLETAFASVVMVADETSLLDEPAGFDQRWRSSTCRWRGSGNLNWLRALKDSVAELRVIALSVNDEKRVRTAAMDAGADAFVLKRDIATELMPAIARVRGEGVVGHGGG